MTRKTQRYPRVFAYVCNVLAAAVCAVMMGATAAAQSAAPAPVSANPLVASSAAPQSLASSAGKKSVRNEVSKVKFSAPQQNLMTSATQAYSLCTGGMVTIPEGKSAMEMDNEQGSCGAFSKASKISGGNPPYTFQSDSGSFPPLGMHLGMNGLLYGTPAPPTLGGYKPFKVCAVDMSGSSDCQSLHVGPPDAAPARTARGGGHTGAWILGGVLVGGGAIALGAGASMTTTGSGSCGSAPENPLNVCPGSGCAADLAAYSSWCKCEGYAGGFDATIGSCVH